MAREGRIPIPQNDRDAQLFAEIAKIEFVDKHALSSPPIIFGADLLLKLSNTLKGNLCPIVCMIDTATLFSSSISFLLPLQAAIFGGVAAQEVLKACTGRYPPISPFFTLNVLDWLHVPRLQADHQAVPIFNVFIFNIIKHKSNFNQFSR